MNILCLNPAVSMRALREMKALHDRGHEITLLYLGEGESVKMAEGDFWKEKRRIHVPRYPLSHLPYTLAPSLFRKRIEKELASGDHDIVHTFSSPDVLGAASARYSDLPTIFDERDMVSAMRIDSLKNYIPRDLLEFGIVRSLGMATVYRRLLAIEREANIGSSGRIYVSDYTMELAKRRHSIPEKNSILFYNYAFGKDVKRSLPKISEGDGSVHLVYAGVLSNSGYRGAVLGVLERIAAMGIHIHIHGIGSEDVLDAYRRPSKKYRTYHFEGPLPNQELMSEMTRYDMGLIPFVPDGSESEYLHTMMPLKMFDYIASGIPILVPDSRSMTPFVERTGTGMVFRDIGEIPDLIEGPLPSFDRKEHIMENRVHEIERLYDRVMR